MNSPGTYISYTWLPVKREDQPECVGPLAIKYIMIDCVDLAHIRNCVCDAGSVKFYSVRASSILLYIRFDFSTRCNLKPSFEHHLFPGLLSLNPTFQLALTCFGTVWHI